MRALLDVNALIALFDASHVNHVKVGAWFAQYVPARSHGWASCPLTQNGVARIIGNARYPNRQPPQATIGILATLCDTPHHQFWPDDISLTDTTRFNQEVVLGSDHLTDVYLLGLAVKNGGKLVTTDTKIPTNAVIGYRSANMLVL